MAGPDSPLKHASPDASGSLSTTGANAGAGPAGEQFLPGKPAQDAPQEAGSLSLAEMAEYDLDAALQLLAERAQYITGASGAAIALRRGQHNDMLCRASAGPSAPELGTLLSMEYGFTGESVRTRQTLVCKDSDGDPRVNREGCRRLGIASVVAMPIVCDGQPLGVFELFSGRPNAFVERDFSALERLCQMVRTAVTHAAASFSVASHTVTSEDIFHDASVNNRGPFEGPRTILPESSPSETKVGAVSIPEQDSVTATHTSFDQKTEPERPALKPLYWSVAMQKEGAQPASAQASGSVPVPAVLRNLKKCQACGFPVSQGRTLCVECEEQQWRGQLVGKSSPREKSEERQEGAVPIPSSQIAPDASSDKRKIQPAYGEASPPAASTAHPPVAELLLPVAADNDLQTRDSMENSGLFLSVAAQSESWLARNRFILPALLVLALIIAAILWLR